MSVQQQAITDDSLSPLLEEVKSPAYSGDRSDGSNPTVALLSVKRRSNSDPRYNKFDAPANLSNETHTLFATRWVPISGDVVAHGMRRSYHGPRRTTLQAHGSKLSAIFLLCSVSLGVGVFVLPGVLLLTGIGPGVIMLAFYAILALYTQLIALECADRAKVKGYEQLASYSFGRLGEFLLGII